MEAETLVGWANLKSVRERYRVSDSQEVVNDVDRANCKKSSDSDDGKELPPVITELSGCYKSEGGRFPGVESASECRQSSEC
jgi:hypothetical protein